MTVQPGWYADPAEPTTQRYWDGDGWVGDPLPIDATPPPGPPSTATAGGAASSGPDLTTDAEGSTTRPTAPSGPAASSGPAPSDPVAPHPTAPPAPSSGAPGSVPPGPVLPPGSVPPGGVLPPGSGPPPGWAQTPYGFPLPPGFVPPPPRPHGHPLAPFGPRLVARLIDIGLVLLLNILVNGWFVWRYLNEVEPLFREVLRRSLAGDSSTEGLPQVSGEADGLQVAILLIAAALWFAYEVPSMANGGQTVGKRLMGVRVVPLATDEPLGFGRSLRRWNLLGLPTFLWCCGLGFLLQLVDCVFPLFDRPLRQALHDKRAQTVVVQVPSSRVAPAGSPAHPNDRDRDRPNDRDRPGGEES